MVSGPNPSLINIREAPDVNPAWPHLVADGDRLVVVWSIYRGTTADEMKSAVRVEWSSRPLDASSGWSTPQTLYVREGGDAGGRLIDLASDPRGGAVVVYGLFNRGQNDLMLQRLDTGKDTWTEPVLIASGDFGYLPVISIASDGTIYAVFNNGRNRDVDIGGLIADPSGKSRRRGDADAGGRRRHGAGLDRPRPERDALGRLYASAGGIDERDRDPVCSRGDVYATRSLLTADQVRARAARAAASIVSTGAGKPVHSSNALAP